MIQNVQKKGRKILIGIDEVSKSEEMISLHQNMEDGFVRVIRFILYALVYMKIFRNFAMSKTLPFSEERRQ